MTDLIKIFFEKLQEKNIEVGLIEYGTRKSNKFSDIDLMIIVTDCKDLKEIHYELEKIEDLVDALRGGNIIIITKEVYLNIHCIEDFNIIEKGGDCPEINLFDKKDQYYRDLISIIDWVPERIGRLDSLLSMEVICLNEVMGILYSLGHSFRYAMRSVDSNYKKTYDQIVNYRSKLENDENFDIEEFRYVYKESRDKSIILVNHVLKLIYGKYENNSSIIDHDINFTYYSNTMIKINKKQTNFHPPLLIHLNNYQYLINQNRLNLKLINSDIPVLDHYFPPNILIIMNAKVKTISTLDINKIKSLKYFSPLRFGYLLK